ncbi:hypothetical protein ACFL5B_02150 [Candidatus Latescibacterota bacterium]
MSETNKSSTIMFTVIDGYTELVSDDKQKARQLLDKSRDIIKPLVKKYKGEWHKDTLSSFSSPFDAVNCAMEIQCKLKDDSELNLRIGIHVGDMVFGEADGVKVASGIGPLAEPGSVCISDQVYYAVRNQKGIEADFLSEKNLENVDRPIKVYSLHKGKEPLTSDKSTEAKPQPSIVVLPFVDMSPDKDNEYFSDGLTEEIITDLSQIHDLLVISRSSAMTFKGTTKTVPEIAQMVNVQHVLEGSVRKAGNNLRITAQLIDATNDTHLWAEKYSGTLDDIFDIQEKVSRSIVDALKLKLTSTENNQIAERPIDNVFAYELYLKAKQEIWRMTEKSLDRALQLLQNGLEIIGKNALFYASIGYVYYQYVNMGFKQENYITKAEDYIKRVFELEPESSQGHFLIGLINQAFLGNQKQSIHHFKLALAANPNDSDVLLWLMLGYSLVGKTSAAGPLVERILKINPLNPINHPFIAVLHCWEGKFDLALERANKSIQMEPDHTVFQFFYALIIAYNQRFDEAFSIIEKMVKTAPEHTFTQWGLFLKYALKREKNKISKLFTREFQNTAERDPQFSSFVASFYSLLGQKEEALNWLENAVNRGFINYPFLNEYDPFLENIRGEERFKKLMERVKNEWENFEV